MFPNSPNIILISGLFGCFCLVGSFLLGFFFLSNEKETIHRQSWSKLRQLLHSPGTCVYLNQRQQLKCCRNAWYLCCTPSRKISGLGFWTVLINELSGWQFITIGEHACSWIWPFNSYFCSFSMTPPLSGLSTVFTREFMILFSIQTCAFSFIFWMSQAL